jgi:hypothetical protein
VVRSIAIFILCPCWFGRLEAKPASSVFGSWLRHCLSKTSLSVSIVFIIRFLFLMNANYAFLNLVKCLVWGYFTQKEFTVDVGSIK